MVAEKYLVLYSRSILLLFTLILLNLLPPLRWVHVPPTSFETNNNILVSIMWQGECHTPEQHNTIIGNVAALSVSLFIFM